MFRCVIRQQGGGKAFVERNVLLSRTKWKKKFICIVVAVGRDWKEIEMGVTGAKLGEPNNSSSAGEKGRAWNKKLEQLQKNYLVVWLDEQLQEKNGVFQSYFDRLQKLSIGVQGFSQTKECLDAVDKLREMKISLIVTGACFREVGAKLVVLPQIQSVYILAEDDEDEPKLPADAPGCGKVRGVFRSVDLVFGSVKRDTRQSKQETLSLSIIQSVTFDKTEFKQLNPLFLYWFLVKQIILDLKFDSTVPKDIGQFCHAHYLDNADETKVIDEFTRDYAAHSPIWWFTRDCFVSTMLNRAFQVQDIEVIVRMAPFIQDLHRQLEQVQKKMARSGRRAPLVYRSKSLAADDFQKMRSSEGNLLSFNHFFVANADHASVLREAQRAKTLGPQLVALLFCIETQFDDASSPVAPLDGLAFAPDSDSLFLFSLQTIFRIGKIEQLEDRLWTIQLTMTDADDRQLLLLHDFVRDETRTAVQWHKLAKFMLLLRDFQQAKEIYHLLLDSLDESDLLKKSHIFNELGLIADEMGEYTLALAYYQKSIEMKQKCLPPNHRLLGVAYNNIGEAQRELGEYFNALSSHKKTLSIKQKTLPANDLSFATTYNNLGLANEALGDFPAALAFYHKALDIKRKVLPAAHIDLATTYNNIGELQREMGNYSAALAYFDKALTIRQRSAKSTDASLATTYNNIGLIHREMGDFPRAIDFFQKSLHVKTKTYRENHPSLAISYLNIGDIHQQLGEFDEALQSYEKALHIQQKSFASHHPEIATTYNNIGVAHQSVGSYSMALSFYQKALKIRQKTLSATHPAIGTSLNNIGHVHQLMGDYHAALDFYQRTLRLQEKALRPNHPSLAATHNNIADIQRKLGNHKTALTLYKKALEIKKKALSATHPSLTTTYNNIGVMHQQMGEYAAALDFYRKTLEIHQKSLPDDHPDLAAIFNNMGVAQQSLKEHRLALDFYHKALKVQEKAFPNDHPDKATTHNSIATVYVNLNDFDKALEHERLAVAMGKATLPPNHPNLDTFENYLQRIEARAHAHHDAKRHEDEATH